MDEEKVQEEKIEVEKEIKPQNHKKTIGLVLLVLLITAVLIVIITNIGDFQKTWDYVTQMDLGYLWIGIGLVVLYLVTWPISLMILSRRNRAKVSRLDDFLIAGSEHFFNAITPFASGGQPIQIYSYVQNGMSAANATGVVISNFIAYLISTNVFAVVSLFWFNTFTANFTNATIWMAVLGFVMNLLTLLFITAIAFSKTLRNIFVKLFKVLGKIKFLSKPVEKAYPKFVEYCDNVQIGAKEIISHKFDFILAIVARTISLLFFYAVPFVIMKGLGVNVGVNDIAFIMLATSFTITTMVWVPTPGGMGGIEYAFTTIFIIFFNDISPEEKTALGVAGMIIWRFLTYYLLMTLSAILYVTYEIIVKYRKKKALKNDD